MDPEGTVLAFSFLCNGFEKHFVTKGSLQSIYGGKDTQRTSSTYFILAGTCLVQCDIVMNSSGERTIKDDIVLGKDPRDANCRGGKWP